MDKYRIRIDELERENATITREKAKAEQEKVALEQAKARAEQENELLKQRIKELTNQ